jgi:hypothetical protein
MGAVKGAAKLTGKLALLDLAVKLGGAVVAVIIAVKAIQALIEDDDR